MVEIVDRGQPPGIVRSFQSDARTSGLIDEDRLPHSLHPSESVIPRLVDHGHRISPGGPVLHPGSFPPIVDRHSQEVHILISRVVILESVAADLPLLLLIAGDDRSSLIDVSGICGREILAVHREIEEDVRSVEPLFPAPFPDELPEYRKILRIRGPRVPSPVHFVQRAEDDLGIILPNKPEKSAVLALPSHMIWVGEDLLERISERVDANMVDPIASEAAEGRTEPDGFQLVEIIIDDRHDRHPDIERLLDLRHELGPVLLKAQSEDEVILEGGSLWRKKAEQQEGCDGFSHGVVVRFRHSTENPKNAKEIPPECSTGLFSHFDLKKINYLYAI